MANANCNTVTNHQARKQSNLLLRYPTNNAAMQRRYVGYHSEVKELLITPRKMRRLGIAHGVTQHFVRPIKANAPHRVGPRVHSVLQHGAAGL